MNDLNNGLVNLKLKKDSVLFFAGQDESDMYIIKKGKVMVFVQKGSQIIPVAYLGKEEYIGELSFFDDEKRSASIICIEDCEFIKISSAELFEHCPQWMRTLGQQLTKKIRTGDELIRSKGIRKKNVEGIKPLTIEEQTRFFKLVDLNKNK